MGVSPERWLSHRWASHYLPVLLAGILATGATEVARHNHPAPSRTKVAVSTVDFVPGPPVTAPPLAPGPGPAPASPPTPSTTAAPAAPPRLAAASARPPVWRPSHPRADYMGATIARRPDAFFAPGLPTLLQSGTSGIDVSNWQGAVNWPAVAAQGVRFAYIKATEATSYTDPQFGANYAGAANAGLIRGAYHFAVPNVSSGAAQADYFVSHGGTWVADGRTLPPALDIEYNPYGADPCYGLTPSQMTAWVADFATTVFNRTGRWPVIYTTTNWWAMCTANSSQAGARSPLWLASWASSGQVRNRPDGWSSYTIWQYADRGAAPGDQDYFNGSYAELVHFAGRSDTRQAPVGAGPVPVTSPPATIPSPLGANQPPTTSPTVPPAPSTAPTTPAAPPVPSSTPVTVPGGSGGSSPLPLASG